MAADRPVLIAGGGIGGLALALALSQAGRRAIVLERRAQFETEGAGIQLGPNGVRVLQRLGVADALRAKVGEPERIDVHDGQSGRTLAAPAARQLAGDTARRTVLGRASRRPARGAAGGGATGTSSCAPVARWHRPRTPTTGVLVTCTIGRDGSRARCWSVPTACGPACAARSRPTRSPCSSALPRRAPCFPPPMRGPLATPAGRPLADARRARRALSRPAGPRRRRRGHRRRGLAGHGLEHASRRGRAARQAGRLPRPRSPRSSWQVRDWRKWALYRLSPLPTWTSGRITLLGDAAHPMLPYLAQGGAMALEDAVVLADALDARGRRNLGARRIRTPAPLRGPPASSNSACAMAASITCAHRSAWARDAVLRLVPGARLMAGFDWLYGWRPPAL